MNRRTRKRKSGFLTFCFSFLPGAGEMYLGFMRMGVSLMGLFFALIALAALLDVPAMLFALVVVWFYSFFHVHNLAGLTDDEFMNIEDEFLFSLDVFFHADNRNSEKYRRMAALILIALGVLLLWDGIKDLFFAYLPNEIWRFIARIENRILKILVGVAIIAGGVRMIKGKEEELKQVTLDADSMMPDAEGGMAGSYGAGNGMADESMAGWSGSVENEGGRSGSMSDESGWNGSMSDGSGWNGSMANGNGWNGSMSDGSGWNGSAAGRISQGGSMADGGGREGNTENSAGANGDFGRNIVPNVIYGVDMQAGKAQERSSYGEGQDY